MKVVKGQRYKHYKGGEYTILAVGLKEDTHEKLVVYQAEYDIPEFGMHAVWIRSYDEFTGAVEQDDNTIPRFKLL